MSYIIEQNVPPVLRKDYPWGSMEIGESLKFDSALEMRRARAAADAWRRYNMKDRGHFKWRQSSPQKRIWRIG